MRYEVLGRLRMVGEQETWHLGAPKPETLLGLLLLKVDEVVSTSQIIDELWGAKPPASVVASVQSYISQLRRHFRGHGDPTGPIITQPSGYLLRLGSDELDSRIFLQRVAKGRVLVKQRRLGEASDSLSGALALWRGQVLGGVTGGPILTGIISWLMEIRIECAEMLVDVELEEGRHREALDRLYPLIAENPLREVFYRQLMLALYRSGCRAEALKVYHAARRRLREELGLEPGRELRSLQQHILNADPRLELAETAV